MCDFSWAFLTCLVFARSLKKFKEAQRSSKILPVLIHRSLHIFAGRIMFCGDLRLPLHNKFGKCWWSWDRDLAVRLAARTFQFIAANQENRSTHRQILALAICMMRGYELMWWMRLPWCDVTSSAHRLRNMRCGKLAATCGCLWKRLIQKVARSSSQNVAMWPPSREFPSWLGKGAAIQSMTIRSGWWKGALTCHCFKVKQPFLENLQRFQHKSSLWKTQYELFSFGLHLPPFSAAWQS